MFGGFNGTSQLDSVELFDTTLQNFSFVGSMSPGREHVLAFLLDATTILAGGGTNLNNSLSTFDTLYITTPRTSGTCFKSVTYGTIIRNTYNFNNSSLLNNRISNDFRSRIDNRDFYFLRHSYRNLHYLL